MLLFCLCVACVLFCIGAVVCRVNGGGEEAGGWGHGWLRRSVSPLLAALSLLIMLGEIGPASWLLAYPLATAQRMWAELGAATEDDIHGDDWHRKTTKRLLYVSGLFADADAKTQVCIANVVLIPVDAFTLYIDYARATADQPRERI